MWPVHEFYIGGDYFSRSRCRTFVVRFTRTSIYRINYGDFQLSVTSPTLYVIMPHRTVHSAVVSSLEMDMTDDLKYQRKLRRKSLVFNFWVRVSLSVCVGVHPCCWETGEVFFKGPITTELGFIYYVHVRSPKVLGRLEVRGGGGGGEERLGVLVEEN